MIVGILGGGQLARMLALAGYNLGLKFIILDPSLEAGAIKLGEHLHGAYDDQQLLAQLAEKADVVTYEFENVPASVADFLAQHTEIHPSANALAVAQDRLNEKNFFLQQQIPTTRFVAIDTLLDLQQAMEELTFPAILKSRRMGYDGKGQIVLKNMQQLPEAMQQMQGVPAIVEEFVNFDREVSIIAARSTTGEIAFYPLSENIHKRGILRVTQSRELDTQQQQAETYATKLLTALDYVGVLALELFDVNGQLLANEMAPRVHNSGHWSIEGAETSQFENHLRAILGFPLGSTQLRGKSAMVNFIGAMPELAEVLALADTHVHVYDKSPRKGRKVGHCTLRTDAVSSKYEQPLQRLIELAQSAENALMD